MKIGDKVRFLSETGGGHVAGFKGNNIVLVEDEDGFQIPTPINEVVVVQDDDYSMKRVVDKQGTVADKGGTPIAHDGRSIKSMMRDGQDEPVDFSEPDTVDDSKEVTYRPKAEERRGGNQLSAYLVFVPMDPKQLDSPHFECYFVNDSNYYMQFAYLTAEGNNWSLKYQAEVEPNTKLFLEELGREEINSLDRVAFQIIAYKRDYAFIYKPAIDVQMRIEPIKFYKMHTFRENPFFDEPSLIYTIVEQDKVARPLVVDPKQLKKEMYAASNDAASAVGQRMADRRTDLVRRYEDNQSKGNRHNSPYVHHSGLDDAIVVDLHADQVLDTTAGMKPGEILDYQIKVFRDTLAQYASKKGQKLIFIHGKGDGVLRRAIINELKYRYKSYTYQDASFQEFGYGATQVTIK
jgi:hypothetical protein